jgi:hypothetical protein
MADTFGNKLARAFKWHWHLLALGLGAGLAVLSGHAEMALPILAAGELAYLGFFGTNDRFQNVLRGGELLKAKEDAAEKERNKLRDLINFLSTEDSDRFSRLRARCVEFSDLRDRINSTDGPSAFAGMRNSSLEKMLWLFLRLLHHKAGLDRFLDNTDEDKLKAQLAKADTDIADATENGRSDQLIKSLQEKREAISERLKNYASAEESRELVLAELDKTEQKIEHINEVGMTNRRPSDLSVQIDGIAESMASSERALGDLRSGLIIDEDKAPSLLSPEAETIAPPPLPLSE